MIARYSGAGHQVLSGGPLHNALHVISGPIFGVDQFPTVVSKACKVAHAIATGHVFVDGNKRTAASAVDLILNLNGYALPVADDDLVQTMESMAAGNVSLEEFTEWVEQRVLAPSGL